MRMKKKNLMQDFLILLVVRFNLFSVVPLYLGDDAG